MEKSEWHIYDDYNVLKQVATELRGRIRYSLDEKSFYQYQNGVFIRCSDDIEILPAVRKSLMQLGFFEELERMNILKKTVKNLKAIKEIQVQSWDFDNKGHNLLNFCNGTLNLATNCIKEHCADDLLTKQFDAEYYPECNSLPKKFYGVLLTLSSHKDGKFTRKEIEARANYLAFLLGKSLCSQSVKDREIIALIGEAGTGKSVLMSLMIRGSGGYARIGNIKEILQGNNSLSQADICDMHDVLFVHYDETSQNLKFDIPKLKNITSGSSEMSAKRPYKKHADKIRIRASLWVSSNYNIMAEDDPGFLDRYIVFYCHFRINEEFRDTKLSEKLWHEKNEIFSALINLYTIPYLNGKSVEMPESVKKDRERYKLLQKEPVSLFLKCVFNLGGDNPVLIDDFYNWFIMFCEQYNIPKKSKDYVGKRMAELGFQRGKRETYLKNNGTCSYKGLSLKFDYFHYGFEKMIQDCLELYWEQYLKQMNKQITSNDE